MKDPLQIMQLAIGDHIKAFADEIGRDKSQIYRWLGDAEVDPHTREVAVIEAAFKVNPAGAALIFEDLKSRYLALRDADVIKGASWDEALSDAMAALAEAMKRGPDFETRVAAAIRALEWLLIHKRVHGE